MSVVERNPSNLTREVLVASDLTKAVALRGQSLEVLRGISVRVNAGESLAIVGRSGSGKTSLLGILAGLDLPSSGQVALMGKNLNKLNEDQRAALRAEHVGFVFQSFHLLPAMTALENVMLPMELKGSKNAAHHAQELLCTLGLEGRLQHFPAQLSGGEQQRVALARAFACKPDILFADEPTGNLDQETGQSIIDLVFELNQQHQTTLIMVTHDEALAKRCQRRIKIEQGKVVDEDGIVHRSAVVGV